MEGWCVELPRKKRKKLTIGKNELRQMYWDEEMSLREISIEFGTTYSAVRNLMVKYGIERRHRVGGAKPRLIVIDDKVFTVKELANKLGVGAATIRRRIEDGTLKDLWRAKK